MEATEEGAELGWAGWEASRTLWPGLWWGWQQLPKAQTLMQRQGSLLHHPAGEGTETPAPCCALWGTPIQDKPSGCWVAMGAGGWLGGAGGPGQAMGSLGAEQAPNTTHHTQTPQLPFQTGPPSQHHHLHGLLLSSFLWTAGGLGSREAHGTPQLAPGPVPTTGVCWSRHANT